MKVQIYNPYWTSMGGGEKYIVVLAEVLSLQGNDVLFLINNKEFSKERLEQYYNIDLSRITIKHINGLGELRKVSEHCDVLFAVTNYRAVPSEAKSTVFVLQAPYGKVGLTGVSTKILSGKIKEGAKDIFRIKLLERCKKAAAVVVYSEYVHNTLLHHHNLKTFVLPPPIDDFFVEGIPKQKIILSVGRIFAGLYNQKRYDILTKAFREIQLDGLNDWEYHIIGSVTNDPLTQEFLSRLRQENSGFRVFFHLNEPYNTLKEWYNKATIFWHAAGYGVNEEKSPEQVEHFGMSTVEAMSAKCIPIVVNKGGQKEIVQSGVNGYLWNSLEELKKQTITVAKDENLQSSLIPKIRERFQDFTRAHFAEEIEKLMTSIPK